MEKKCAVTRLGDHQAYKEKELPYSEVEGGDRAFKEIRGSYD
jgi:hypothetical protein